jgi:hypothetical protein
MKYLYSMLLLLLLAGFGFAAVGDTRTITYYLNGGVNDPANPDSYVVIKADSSECTITLQEPTREGSRFLGWFKEAPTGVFYAIPKLSTFACIELQNDIVANENLLDAEGNGRILVHGLPLDTPALTGGFFEGFPAK